VVPNSGGGTSHRLVAGTRRAAGTVAAGAAAVACLRCQFASRHGAPGESAAHTTPSAQTTAKRNHPPVSVGSATATLAARLATLPTASSAHGNNPPRRPVRESASTVVDAAAIIPSTENGVSMATQPGCPCRATSVCKCK
jgi:hypothetical protein